MGTSLVEGDHIGLEDAGELLLVQDQQVIEALAAAGQAADMMTAALTEARTASQILAPPKTR